VLVQDSLTESKTAENPEQALTFAEKNMRKISTVMMMTVLLSGGCVRQKLYRTEVAARSGAESREKVLNEELTFRKKEASDLIRKIGDLNKTVGSQEEQIRQLQTELIARTQSMGASSTKLSAENTLLSRQLAEINEILEQKNSEIEKIRQVQTKQEAILRDHAVTLERAFQPYKDALKISHNATSVTIVLPDKLIFDQGGVTVSEGGRAVLTIVSEYLAAFPGIDASIISHTDNVLPPKEKTFKDTWDWSIARASGIVRVLTRELNVTANQLTAIGRGEFYPAASNETPEGRSANRRTEIVFYPVLPVIPAAGE